MPEDNPFLPPAPSSSSKKRALLHAPTSPAKRQSKWTPQEDALIIQLRGMGKKWDDISKALPGRSPISCRLHYQNYLERRPEWDEGQKNLLAMLYERLKSDMWVIIAREMKIPWRAAEAMHWQLGEEEIARRAGTVPFSHSSSVALQPPPKKHKSGPGPETSDLDLGTNAVETGASEA
ncbi:hypothetical protein EV426DRAFT_702260 [Tirmania nivea]|nr:hypothetical protein EV426DRAFT_702260 [Tirmania nivea]